MRETYRTTPAGPDDVETIQAASEHEEKIRGGGLAHRRYQRTAENVWVHNAEEVAKRIRSKISGGFRLVVLAGEPGSRSEVRAHLGNLDEVQVTEIDSGGRARDGGDEAMLEQVNDVLVDYAKSRRAETTDLLADRLGRGEGAAAGVDNVADAFVRGQVHTLLLDLAETTELSLTPSEHPGLPVDGVHAEGAVQADLALVAAAAATGSDVMVCSREEMAGASVAALLRWDQ